jgi:hypothetical protein
MMIDRCEFIGNDFNKSIFKRGGTEKRGGYDWVIKLRVLNILLINNFKMKNSMIRKFNSIGQNFWTFPNH